jgi:hypothetical protein
MIELMRRETAEPQSISPDHDIAPRWQINLASFHRHRLPVTHRRPFWR